MSRSVRQGLCRCPPCVEEGAMALTCSLTSIMLQASKDLCWDVSPELSEINVSVII